MNLNFRPLRADEIEVRVARKTEKGTQFLLYKDARADMNLLDETVGAENWKRSHELINGNLYCNVSIRITHDDGTTEWVTKQDVGTESNTEKEKGEASDSFKRACVNWGIGRELYTAPFIWISAAMLTSDGKYKDTGIEVDRMTVEGDRIVFLSLINQAGKNIYTYQDKARKTASKAPERAEKTAGDIARDRVKIDSEKADMLRAEIVRTGNDEQKWLDHYHIKSLEELSVTQYAQNMAGLRKKATVFDRNRSEKGDKELWQRQ